MRGGAGQGGREDGDEDGGGGGWVEVVVAAAEVGRVGSCWGSFRVVCHCRVEEGSGKGAELDEN